MNPEQQKITDEINQMATEDQKYRQAKPSEIKNWDEINQIDQKNLARIKEIISQYGCITISKFGEKTAQNAWLIIQHQTDDLEFMEHYCELMEKNINDVHKKNWAYLKDRILINRGENQLYGSQWFKGKDDAHFFLREIDDIENVDQRRTDVGLPTLDESIRKAQQDWDDGIVFPEGYVEKTYETYS